ncbi:hypothetical protein MUP07_00685 [Candidatus Bathyarchaeota archaeon]|nr:hypothetical protein [Candidatus Bathyarchaeota archaeon]
MNLLLAVVTVAYWCTSAVACGLFVMSVRRRILGGILMSVMLMSVVIPISIGLTRWMMAS